MKNLFRSQVAQELGTKERRVASPKLDFIYANRAVKTKHALLISLVGYNRLNRSLDQLQICYSLSILLTSKLGYQYDMLVTYMGNINTLDLATDGLSARTGYL